MAQDRIIYTDGRDVVVTDSTLQVRKNSYKLSGITKLSFWTIRPERWPAVVLLLLGLVAAVAGYLRVFSEQSISDAGAMSANTLSLYIGVGLVILGLLSLIISKERYAVRIGTAEGEKNAVVSSKREYIAQIVDAIHSAFDLRHPEPPIVIKK